MQNLPQNKKIILFDGLCNLCDASVQFICKRDTKDTFRFVSLQSDLGKEIIHHLGIDTQKVDSILLFTPNKNLFWLKSKAVFEIVKQLGGIYCIVLVFRLLPTPITDAIYNTIAKNRYRWFGKKENCLLPSKAILDKFLD